MIDLSSLPTGNYVLYIENTVNSKSFYGEIIDASYTDFTKINNSNYLFSRNDNIRLRLELKVNKWWGGNMREKKNKKTKYYQGANKSKFI